MKIPKTTFDQIFEKDQRQHETVFTIPVTVTRCEIENIIVGALEGGSNYWYWLPEVVEPLPELPPENNFFSYRIVEALITIPNFELPVQDIETREPVGSLSLESLKSAIAKTAKERKNIFQDLMEGDLDANGADYIFQLAVMGEEVYC